MSTRNWPHVLRLLGLLSLLPVTLLLLAAPGFAVVGVDDDFDAETVGVFPTTWQHFTVGAGQEAYVTNSISATPSLPNVFMIHYLTNTTDDIRRNFTTIPLTTDQGRALQVTYDLRVDSLTPDFSAGFALAMGNTSIGDSMTPWRVLSGTAGAGTWAWYDGTTRRADNLATGVWYTVRTDTWLTNAATGAGIRQWYLDDSLFYTEAFTVFGLPRTNINYLRFTMQGVAATGEDALFFFDNFNIGIIPEPSTTLLLGVGGWLMFRLRQGFGGKGPARRRNRR